VFLLDTPGVYFLSGAHPYVRGREQIPEYQKFFLKFLTFSLDIKLHIQYNTRRRFISH